MVAERMKGAGFLDRTPLAYRVRRNLIRRNM